LAEKIFEPIRNNFKKPIGVSSGYRSRILNESTPGSSRTSQHSTGEALDLDQDNMGTGITNKMVFDFIRENLEFDQLIWEYGNKENPDWVHVSYESSGRQRKQVLRCTRENGKPKQWLLKAQQTNTKKFFNTHKDLILTSGFAASEEFDYVPVSIDTNNDTSTQGEIILPSEEIKKYTELPGNFNLSPNFTVEMLSSKATLTKSFIEETEGIKFGDIIYNLTAVALNILEPAPKSVMFKTV
jgi:hypothetical protein